VADGTVRAEKAARWPWFRFSAAPRVRRNEFFAARTDLVLGVDVTVPILNLNGGRIQSATAERDAARAGVEGILQGLRAEIARARAEISTQRTILRRLHTELLPLLAAHDQLLVAAAQSAELDVRAFVSAEDMALQSRTQIVAARLALRKATIDLERAVGEHVQD
jgi:hypothetical protein